MAWVTLRKSSRTRLPMGQRLRHDLAIKANPGAPPTV